MCLGGDLLTIDFLAPTAQVLSTVVATGCTTCQTDEVARFHLHVVNPGDPRLVELKTGVRFPDGSIVPILGGHVEFTVPAGESQTARFEIAVPAEVPAGSYEIEAALLEPHLGATLVRHKLPVQKLP